MGAVIHSSGNSLRANSKRIIPPVDPTGFKGIFLFGDSVAQSVRNYAGGADLVVTGNPVIGSDGQGLMLREAVDYLTTGFTQDVNSTIIVMFQAQAQATFPLSTYPGPRLGDATKNDAVGTGVQMYSSAGNVGVHGFIGTWDGATAGSASTLLTSPVPSAAPPAGSYRMFGVRSVAGVAPATVTVDDLTAGTKSSRSAAAGQVLDRTTRTYRIGSSYQTTAQPAVKTLGAFIISRILTDGEMATMYQWMKGYWARRGISI